MADKQGAVHVDGQELAKMLDNTDTPVLVDFFAEWCGPCKMAAPIIDKLADEYDGKIKIVKLDVDENNQTAAENGVMSIPTVIIYDTAGEEADRQIGFPGEDGYRRLIEKHLQA